MKVIAICTTSLISAVLSPPLFADDVSLDSVPPVVVKTVPEAGVTNVDPDLSEIKVTYSKEMSDGSWSWSTFTKDSFPKVDGNPRYLDDKRTCVLPVKLQTGKTYAIWLNSAKFGNFRDTDGRSAVPYLLVFQTKE
jgi:RNA polymerase sigma-70 factor (ECF subfamily)